MGNLAGKFGAASHRVRRPSQTSLSLISLGLLALTAFPTIHADTADLTIGNAEISGKHSSRLETSKNRGTNTAPAKRSSKEPVFSTAMCRPITLRDNDTNALIVGAEDIAIDHKNGDLFISAYDRRAVEKSASRKSSSKIPEGGLYKVNFETLSTMPNELSLKSLIRREDVEGGLRPHGITLDQQSNEVVFINRAFKKIGKNWKQSSHIRRVGAKGAIIITQSTKTHCAANDLVTNKSTVLVSFDHANCNWSGRMEDIFNLPRSGIVGENTSRPFFQTARHANGLIALGETKMVLAATRDKALHFLRPNHDGSLEPTGTVKVPGGPDNLTLGQDGKIIAAVHPSLFKMGLHRKLGWGRAGSRIVSVDPDTRHVTLLYDDPSGKQFQAATVGARHDNILVLGSVTDKGLLVCKAAQ